jgi:mono/diheme cytochrome c family protein
MSRAIATFVLASAAALALSTGAQTASPPARAKAAQRQRLAAPPPPAPTGDRAVFVANGCWQCHGYDGQGGEALRIAPTPYPFEAFAARVRKPANEMPAYAPSALSDADLQAIYRFLKSLPEPTVDVGYFLRGGSSPASGAR